MEKCDSIGRLRQEMSAPEKTHGWSLGPALIFVGVAAIVLSGNIVLTGLGDTRDPGPRAFPLGVGICLVLGGMYQLGLWVARGGRAGAIFNLASARNFLADTRNRDAWVLIGALCLYVLAISWIGFSLSTVVFGTGMMMRLGASWWLAGGMSLLLMAAINVLFVGLFKVQFPAGVVGLPF
jgi:putative tricarboxylic transport membrane protein